mgnify:FL=1
MQRAYISALYSLMQQDKRVVSLLSDSGTDYDELMAREMPQQCYNFGISEQNKLGIAAGMAMCGKIPFVYTSGAFLAFRGYEFIRNDVCYQNQNVKIVGMGSGTSWRTLGPSHHTTEDLAALRAIPNLSVLSPATPVEAAECVRAAYEHTGPVYIRLGMGGEPEYFDAGHTVAFGRTTRLADGSAAAVFCTGSILGEVMASRGILLAQGIDISVYDVCSIKPFDAAALLEAAGKCNRIFTVEEHSISGGLGGAAAEILAGVESPAVLTRIGLDDRFAKGYGSQEEVRRKNGLDAESIAETIWGRING